MFDLEGFCYYGLGFRVVEIYSGFVFLLLGLGSLQASVVGCQRLNAYTSDS